MIKFALVGCGHSGQQHAEQMRRIGTLVAVCDVDYAKAEKIVGNARIYHQIDELLASEPEVEVVVVCTPNGLHAEHVIKALQSRRHVLCERPLCIASSAAWSMRDTAHFFRRHLLVVEETLVKPSVLKAKALLAGNKLGNILSFSIEGFCSLPQEYYDNVWHGTTDLDGGILYTQFSHFIDVLLLLLGDVVNVKTVTQNSGLHRGSQTEDTVVAVLQMKSGSVGTAHFSINSIGGHKESSFNILCENGSIKIGGASLDTIDWTSTNNSKMEMSETDYNKYVVDNGIMNNYHLVYDELQKALAGEQHSLPHINDAVLAIQMIEKIYAAAGKQ